jgi:putative ABC transport system ATP-binding protein
MSVETILKIDHVSKTYKAAGRELTVLQDISFSVEAGETVAIVGPSGSGKTTLLGLSAGLDRSTTGTVELNGIPLTQLDEDERAVLRNRYVGFIFQNFQLLPTLTALENVMVPLELRGAAGPMGRGVAGPMGRGAAEPMGRGVAGPMGDPRAEAKMLLEQVGLGDRLHHYPAQLSGGEQQRVSLARAFANRPRILFADEPTGNLDSETSEKVAELLFELNRQAGTTLILVTHNLELAEGTRRTIRLAKGHILSDEKK